MEASPKRHSLFQKVDISEDGAFVRTLKNLSATRWSANWEAVRAVIDEMFRIIKCLIELRKDRDAKISSTAKALLVNILDFEFVFGLHLLKIILPSTSKLSSFIQSTTIDVRKVLTNVKLTTETLKSCRDDNNFELVWESASHDCEKIQNFIEQESVELDFKNAKLPRSRQPALRRQALLGEESGGHTVMNDVRNHYRVNLFYPALDKTVTELKERFSENYDVVLCALSSVIFDPDPTQESFKTLSQFYNLDEELLKADHQLFKHVKEAYVPIGSASSEMFKLLHDNATLAMIPELSKAVKIYTVIPATSCSAERSFSALRRLKTYLRSTMGQHRLSDLALLTVERKYVNEVIADDMEAMIDEFGSRKNRDGQYF